MYGLPFGVIVYTSNSLLIVVMFLAHSVLTFSIASPVIVFLQDDASSYRNMLLALVKGN